MKTENDYTAERSLLVILLFSCVSLMAFKSIDPEVRNVRIDLQELRCINNDDEIGIAEQDEVYVKTLVRVGNGKAVIGKFGTWNDVGDGDAIVDAGFSEHKNLRLAQAALKPGEALEMVVLVMEKDQGPPKDFDKVLTEVGVGYFFGAHGPVIALNVLQDAHRRILGRGDDDLLGSFMIRVWNRNGNIEKELIPMKRAKLNGHGDKKTLSKSGKTIRMRLRHNQDANTVDYFVGVQVRDLDAPQRDAQIWSLDNSIGR